MTAMSLVGFLIASRRGGGGAGGGDDGGALPDVPAGNGVRGVGGGDGPGGGEGDDRRGGGGGPPSPPASASTPAYDGPWRSGNCAVLSMASASGLEDHERFVGSLRATGYSGRIILGISPDAPGDVIRYLESQDVTYHRVHKAASCARNGTEGAEPMYMTYDDESGIGTARRIIIDADGTGWNCPREHPDYKLTWARFFYYGDWLRDCGGCTDGIMLTDFRDAYFQAGEFWGSGIRRN